MANVEITEQCRFGFLVWSMAKGTPSAWKRLHISDVPTASEIQTAMELPLKFHLLRPFIQKVGRYPTVIPSHLKLHTLESLNVPPRDFIIGGSTLNFLSSPSTPKSTTNYSAFLSAHGIMICKHRPYIYNLNSYGLQLERILTGTMERGWDHCRHESVNGLTLTGPTGASYRIISFTECDAVDASGASVEIKCTKKTSSSLPKTKTFLQIISSQSYVLQGIESNGQIVKLNKLTCEELRPENASEIFARIYSNLEIIKQNVVDAGIYKLEIVDGKCVVSKSTGVEISKSAEE